jgi:ATP-dependent Clp protease protease subunit
MSRKFWRWDVKNKDEPDRDTAERTLYLSGEISDETWFGDEVTPRLFRDELAAGSGNITVWVNSPGGDVFAAAQIYNMLMEYPGHVTVKIDGLAASAASVIAMAGSEVLMSPVSMIMVHNPSTIAIGDGEEMLRAKALLDEVKESILNAYELKTGQSRTKLAHLMDAETWMNANKAVELGFADKILYTDEKAPPADDTRMMMFSRAAVYNSFLGKIPKPEKLKNGTPAESLEKRLSLISH